MKTLYIIRGLPGSGKSTLAGYLCQGIKAQVCEADRYFTANDGVYKFDPSRLPDAHAYCQAICEELMVDGTPFLAVSNTFSRRWEMEPYRELARKYGYEVTVIEVQTSLSDEQLAERNVHGVHKDAIARMRARWENLRG